MRAIPDQSTSELRANLMAGASGRRRRLAGAGGTLCGDIREIEEELKARGEKLEERKPKRPGRHEPLTRWYAVGFHDRPGWPVPKTNTRHIDRLCGYLADKPDEDIRELAEQEIAEHEPCRGCAG